MQERLITLLVIGCGGFLGAVARQLSSSAVQKVAARPWFPYGTMAVNLAGCLFIGLLVGWAEGGIFGQRARMFLLTGLLGGFTTFSTFGLETFNLLLERQLASAALNVSVQVVVGLTAVWFGLTLSKITL